MRFDLGGLCILVWQIIGQDRIISLFKRSLEAGSLAHAYLLVGPPHVGKMTLALNLAKALNCGAVERPCGECISCQKIISLGHADVQVIGLLQNDDSAEAKLISTDQIEQMQHSANLSPFEGEHKVFIIDGAERLSIEAANRLLKTLEEPMGKVVFVLLTVNDSLLPATVVSRCQRLELIPLAAAEIESALIARWGVDPQRAKLLAGLSHGCPGWALAAGSDDSLLQKREEALSRLVSVISADNVERFAYVAQLASQFSRNRGLVYEELGFWLDYWRDLMLVKIGCRDIITNGDRLAILIEMAGGYRLTDIKDFIESICATGEQLRQNVNPRLALEVLMLDIPGKMQIARGLTR
ncbi:ATP-binding protein [Chloroflexota bacterium]